MDTNISRESAVSILYVEDSLHLEGGGSMFLSETLVPIRDRNGSSEISRCSKSVEGSRE
jgi:hypothetical protein